MRLHKQMFGDVWKWAGDYRTSERNIGIEACRIGVDVVQLMNDVRHWVENKTYSPAYITGWWRSTLSQWQRAALAVDGRSPH